MTENDTKPTHVTKTFLPPRAEFDRYVDQIWESGWLTNNGPLSQQFSRAVTDYLSIDESRFVFVANGTLALQLALRNLVGNEADAEIITTPFTYVATTSAILWERYVPVFVDIDPQNLNIDPKKIESAITPKTRVILAVHVFGNPCDVEMIEGIARKHNLKVLYDASHAFGVWHRGRSLLEYGDASTLSFHATKIMHTIEGGAVYVNSSREVAETVELSKRFGHNGDDHFQLGINAKASEFQAAMGLSNIGHIDEVIAHRKAVSELYDDALGGKYQLVSFSSETRFNYSYYPIVFASEESLLQVFEKLAQENIFPRRYFYPSLNTLPYLDSHPSCPIAEDISSRIACLPIDAEINEKEVRQICRILLE